MKESMRSKLNQLGRRLEEIDAMLAAPDAANDMNRFRDLSRERAEIEPVVGKMKDYESTEADIEAAREMLGDADMQDFAQEEIDKGKQHLEDLEKELQIMCVLFTEDVGGILTLEFEPDGTLEFKVQADDGDYLFDEIGSGLKIRRYQREKRELLEALELYYRVVFLGERMEKE